MDKYIYIIAPFVAWFVAGCLKFIVNSFKKKRMAYSLIGYGGFPSNHTSIVSSALTISILESGLNSPIVSVAVALVFIVMLDANSLRRQVGIHAEKINKLNGEDKVKLRERIGHTKVELLGGLVVGASVAILLKSLFL